MYICISQAIQFEGRLKNFKVMHTYSVEKNDLITLYDLSKSAYGCISFERWEVESKKSYLDYINLKKSKNKKALNYSRFVNAQIIALTVF